MVHVRTDILKILKVAGYSTYRLRKENLLSESTMSRLRHGADVNLTTVSTIMDLIPIELDELLVVEKGGK